MSPRLAPIGLCDMWVVFIMVFVSFLRFFSVCFGFSPGASVFLPPEKQTFPNSNSIKIEGAHKNQLGSMWHLLVIL